MITVWGRKTSSNVQAVMWCIAELDLPYRRLDIGHRFGGTDTPEFIAMNPNQTVPVLQDGDMDPLWETGAILRYLAHRYGGASFWPVDLAARTNIDRWAEWAKINVLLGFTTPIFWRVVRTAPRDHDIQAIRHACAVLEKPMRIAEAQLGRHPFLAGDNLTIADIQLGHILYRYFDIDIERPALPHLRSYYDRLTDRPAYREHVMVSYEELRVV